MTLETRQLIIGCVYIMIAAAVVFFTPHKYHIWIVGLLVVGMSSLWRLRKSL